MLKDIETKSDIETLVNAFYDHLLLIEEMKPVFAGLDFKAHVPRIVHFWSFVLLDEPGYTTNVFDKHLHLPISPPLFDVWLHTFTSTVDSLFSGERAEMAKQRATVISYTFKSKWEKINPQN
ncbi:MAG: group III truncated hemoglobin [Bacteroidia bacterium]|nr:group III truncated hemoglobin [Bacteroidia bacterium]